MDATYVGYWLPRVCDPVVAVRMAQVFARNPGMLAPWARPDFPEPRAERQRVRTGGGDPSIDRAAQERANDRAWDVYQRVRAGGGTSMASMTVWDAGRATVVVERIIDEEPIGAVVRLTFPETGDEADLYFVDAEAARGFAETLTAAMPIPALPF